MTDSGFLTVPAPGRGEIRFDLLCLAGVEAGRAKFERLVTDVVKVIHPTAREVRANPGDWGIDTFVGELVNGDVAVWQSKFFMEPSGASQQKQIRDSFTSIKEHSKRKKLQFTAWTLAVPGTMDGDMARWWDGWKKRTLKKEAPGFAIELWQEADLRGHLMGADFSPVRAQYFGADPSQGERATQQLDDPSVYDSALFVRQLGEAGIVNDRTARRAFFNAEVLTRDIREREVEVEVEGLVATRSDVEQLWSTRFEGARSRLPAQNDGQLSGLYADVCGAVEQHHREHPSPVLRDTLVHRTGLMHQLVEEGAAGWVTHFPNIASQHALDEHD